MRPHVPDGAVPRPAAWRRGVIAGGMLLLGGCVRTVDFGTVEVAQDMGEHTMVRSARNLPAEFTVLTAPAVTGDCPRRLTDQGAGTLLDLARSMTLPVQDTAGSRLRAFGDYTVTPRGYYGDSEPNDAVRVDCTRLRALGIVSLDAAGG